MLLNKHKKIHAIKSIFSKNSIKNDQIIEKFLFSTPVMNKCMEDLCPGNMFHIKCSSDCSCKLKV